MADGVFIPFPGGVQAYPYDTRTLKVKLIMWFWEHIGIPLSGNVIKGKTLQFEHVTGEKIKYVNCAFKRCRFDGLKLVFILNSTIEHETLGPEFHNLVMCKISGVVFSKVSPVIIGGEKIG